MEVKKIEWNEDGNININSNLLVQNNEEGVMKEIEDLKKSTEDISKEIEELDSNKLDATKNSSTISWKNYDLYGMKINDALNLDGQLVVGTPVSRETGNFFISIDGDKLSGNKCNPDLSTRPIFSVSKDGLFMASDPVSAQYQGTAPGMLLKPNPMTNDGAITRLSDNFQMKNITYNSNATSSSLVTLNYLAYAMEEMRKFVIYHTEGYLFKTHSYGTVMSTIIAYAENENIRAPVFDINLPGDYIEYIRDNNFLRLELSFLPESRPKSSNAKIMFLKYYTSNNSEIFSSEDCTFISRDNNSFYAHLNSYGNSGFIPDFDRIGLCFPNSTSTSTGMGNVNVYVKIYYKTDQGTN